VVIPLPFEKIFKKKNVKLENIPQILEEPWVIANNSLNIRKGFEKGRHLPLE